MKTLTLLFLVALSMPALAQDPEQPGATSNVAVRGSLSKEVIREVIRRHLNEARYCYERSLQRSPDLAGRVIMRFTIDANGRVSAATAFETPAGFEQVAQCLAARIRRWRFPDPLGGGIVIVTYPFVFNAG